MNRAGSHLSPRLAQALLTLLLPGASAEEVLGDLEEALRRRVAARGLAEGRRWYWGQTVRLLMRLPEDWVLESGGISMGAFGHDLRYGLRALVKTPVFTGIIVLILAIGIGTNTAIFSVLNAAFLKPLPYPEPDQLTILWNRGEDGGWGPASGPDYLDWRADNHTFADMGAFRGRYFNLTGQDEPERARGAIATASIFRLLHAQPALGRTFVTDDEQEASGAVALLSHGLWTRRFGADPAIVGRSIRVDGRPLTVIGVMPPGFQVPSPWWNYSPPQQLWTPFPAAEQHADRGSHSYPVIGRLKDGVSLEVAQEDMRAVSTHLAEQYPKTNAGQGAWVVPLRAAMYGEAGFQVIMVFGAAGLVLLIACGNVAALQLAWASGRRTEFAVRAAIGAGRGRVARQLLTESMFLALGGGAAGVLLAIVSLHFFRSLIPSTIPRVDQIAVDGPALLFALVVCLLTGIVFGLVPALSAGRVNLTDALNEGRGRSGSGARKKERLRSAFVTLQFALSFMLLNGGFLLLRSYTLLQANDPGFQSHNVLTMALSMGGDRFAGAGERARFVADALASLRSLPGVEAAGASTKLPLLGGTNSWGRAEHEPPRVRPIDGWLIEKSAIEGDYHQVMGIPLLAGRLLTPADTASSTQNVVINSAMAKRMWPNENPLGKRFTFDEDPPEWITVVGVVGDVRQWGLESRPISEVYYPYSLAGQKERVYLTLKSETDPETLAAAARARILALDPDQPVSEIRTMDQIRQASMGRREFFTLMTGFFALIALILASVGIYGVISYHVHQRTHEIGIRIAVGAARGRVLRLVLVRAGKLAGVGLVLGVAGALATGAVTASLLWGVAARDPRTLALTGLVLAAIALVASLVPALRAMRVSPVEALRTE
jgi:predicted permease